MPPPPWLPTLTRTIAAYAVSTIIPLPNTTTSLHISSDTIFDTLADPSCNDIHHCRTLAGLVQSCLVTILACVWYAVHRNIPAPKVDRPRHDNRFTRIVFFVWYKICTQRQATIILVVALVIPEWIAAWAVRQLLMARQLTKKLNQARAFAPEVSRALESDEVVRARRVAKADGGKLKSAQVHSQLNTRDVAWKMSHAFFIIMGGFHFFSDTGPIRPLSPEDVVKLVKLGHLVPPTNDELESQSKGDALSKCFAIVQTLWFILQCIARYIEHYPVTSLEVLTLAYTVITLIMYMVWWRKPLNVSCAIRVPVEELMGSEMPNDDVSSRQWIVNYIVGSQDAHVDLRRCSRVPTFWAGKPDRNLCVTGNIIALFVAIVFGAVHCIAWSYAFQSRIEQQLWRASAIAITAVPATIAVVYGAVRLPCVATLKSTPTPRLLLPVLRAFYVPMALIYIMARLILIVISFNSLRTLPFTAYQTVQWTVFAPHI